jgi:hypothetical protein
MKDIPAFPLDIIYTQENVRFNGMTLRDYFAAQAMTGLLTAETVGEYTNEHIANISFLIADAMMKERTDGL